MSAKRTFWQYATRELAVGFLVAISTAVTALTIYAMSSSSQPGLVIPIIAFAAFLIGGYYSFKKNTRTDVADFSRSLIETARRYGELFLGEFTYSLPSIAREILQDQNLRGKYGEVIQGWTLYFNLAEENIVRHQNALVKGLESCIARGRYKDFKELAENRFDGLVRQAESMTSMFFAMRRALSADWTVLAGAKKIQDEYETFAKNQNNLVSDTYKLVTELKNKADTSIYTNALVRVKENAFEFDRSVKP